MLFVLLVAASQGSCQVLAEEHEFEIRDSYWALPTPPENRTFVVVLRYCGDTPAGSLNASLNVSQISSSPSVAPSTYNGSLSRGDTIYLKFEFNLSPAAVEGGYLLPLKIDYMSGGIRRSFESKVRVDVMGSPDIEFEPGATSVIKGEVNKVEVAVWNRGDGLARNVRLSVQSQSAYLTLLGINQFELGAVKPGEAVFVELTLFAENGISDGTSLLLSVSYEGEDGSPYTRVVSVGIRAEEAEGPHLSASTDRSELAAGVANNVTLHISNTGGSSALEVSVRVTPTSDRLTLVGTNLFEPGDVEPGKSVEIPLNLFLDQGVYGSLRVSVSLSYKDARNASFTELVTIGFTEAALPEPLVEVSANASSLRPNSVNVISFTVKNIGTGSAQNVTVSLYSQSPQLAVVVGAGTSSAWEILPNSSLTAERSIFVQPGVFGAVPVYVQVQYKDSLNNYHSYTSTFGFSVEAEPEVSVSTVTTVPSPVFPGDKVVNLACLLVNSGNYTAENVRIELGRVPGVVSPSYAGTDRCTIPYLQVGGSVQVKFLVDIESGAPPGYYEVPLTIMTTSGNTTASVPLTVRERAPVSVESVYFDREVPPGERNAKLFIRISNNGSQTAEQLRLSLVSGYVSGSTSTLVGRLPGNSSKIVMMEVDIDKNAQPGSLHVDVELSWVQDGRQLSSTVYGALPIATPAGTPLFVYAGIACVLGVLVVVFRKRALRLVGRNG